MRYYNHDGMTIRVAEDYSGDVAKLRVASFKHREDEPPLDDYMTVTIDELPMHGIWEEMRIQLLHVQHTIDMRNRSIAYHKKELAELGVEE